MTSRTRNVGSVSQTIFRALDKMAAGSGLGTRLVPPKLVLIELRKRVSTAPDLVLGPKLSTCWRASLIGYWLPVLPVLSRLVCTRAWRALYLPDGFASMMLAARKQWRSLLRGLQLRSLSACPTDRKLFLTRREGVPATIIDGKAISQYIRSQLSREVKQLVKTCGRPPSLVVILVGDDPGSRTYVGAKAKAARKVGIANKTIRLSKTVSESDLLARIDELNRDDTVDGLLVQLPVPPHISTDAVCNRVRPSKDVDGYTVVNLGHLYANSPMHVPATARGIRDMVELCGFETEGKRVCVVGASRNVGAPIAKIFCEGGGNATVTICHRFTTRSALNECSKQADILIVCAGKPGLITAEMVKPGAIVVDVGINEIVGPDGEIKLMGDVDFPGVSQVAGAISPVPGGVGPLTVAGLLMNTVDAYQQHMTAESQRVSSNM